MLQRNNPAKEYPSDFDVIVLEDEGRRALDALKDHPAIRRVTAQRQVTRTIKYIREVNTYMYPITTCLNSNSCNAMR